MINPLRKNSESKGRWPLKETDKSIFDEGMIVINCLLIDHISSRPTRKQIREASCDQLWAATYNSCAIEGWSKEQPARRVDKTGHSYLFISRGHSQLLLKIFPEKLKKQQQTCLPNQVLLFSTSELIFWPSFSISLCRFVFSTASLRLMFSKASSFLAISWSWMRRLRCKMAFIFNISLFSCILLVLSSCMVVPVWNIQWVWS